MLKRACIYDLEAIKKICEGSIIGCKIICQIISYGFERDFLEIWIMVENNLPSAVITKFYDDATIIAEETVDTEQLNVFLSMYCFKTVMLSEKLAYELGLENIYVKNGYCFAGSTNNEKTDVLGEDDYRDAYMLISHEIPGSFKNDREAFLSFLSDFTFRQRRSLARGVCIHDGTKIVSVAITSSETAKEAIISGVACDSSYRRKGLGKTTVLSIVEKLLNENKKPYVIALNKSAEGFYEHIGFIKHEVIAFHERDYNV